MVEINDRTDIGSRQRPKPWPWATARPLWWPLKPVVTTAAMLLLLSLQPAKALVYNLVDVDVTFLYPTLFFGLQPGSATITGSFDYTAGDQLGTFSLGPVDIDYTADPDAFTSSFDQGFVVNDSNLSYLVFYQGSEPNIPSSPDCDDAFSPCLRLNLDQSLVGTVQTVGIVGGSNNAGSSSTFAVLGALELTANESSFNVIRAVPSPFSALLFAPLLPLLRYRRRFRHATQAAAQTVRQ